MVFGEEQRAVAALPRPHVVANRDRRPRRQAPGELRDTGQELGPAACQQGQPVDRPEQVGAERLRREHVAGVVEDPPRLRAVIRGGRRIRAQHPQRKPRLSDAAGSPTGESEDAAAGLSLGHLDGASEALASIGGEPTAIHAENHVARLHDAVGGGATADVGHEDLPAGGGGPPLHPVEVARGPGVNPAPQPRRPEVVGLRAIPGRGLRQVRRWLRRRAAHRGEDRQPEQRRVSDRPIRFPAGIARPHALSAASSARARSRLRRARTTSAASPLHATATAEVGSGTTTSWNPFGLTAVCR